MAGVSSNPNSPRQKMINLMYLVFIAMMAMNVSKEVLNGFELVERSLQKSITNSSHRNEIAMKEFQLFYELYPERVGESYKKATSAKTESDDLFNYIEGLKIRIVQETDGKDGNPSNIKNKENLDAASHVMLAPIVGEGKKLREKIESYRKNMGDLVVDTAKTTVIESVLDMKEGLNGRTWETALFEEMPVAAAITILTKIQSDVRYVEGEVLSALHGSSVDVKAYRVNKIDAMVIPQSQIVMQGTPYKAEIVLAAFDSTQRPQVFIDGQKEPLADNWFTGGGSSIGEHPFSGKIVLGGNKEYPFKSSYFVTEQTATIAPTMMNVLYENINNDIEIAIPGVPSGSVKASISAGTMTPKNGNVWTARPPSNATSVKIIVTANVTGGSPISMEKEFRVRPLPPAQPYIAYKDASDATRKFTGGNIAKKSLVEADGIRAAIDDGILDIQFTVTSFQLTFFDSMGNAVPEVSQSGSFTQRQKDLMRSLTRGKRFFVTNIKANDPGGKSQNLAPIEVIVN